MVAMIIVMVGLSYSSDNNDNNNNDDVDNSRVEVVTTIFEINVLKCTRS